VVEIYNKKKVKKVTNEKWDLKEEKEKEKEVP
jgi:hypothetical protein